MNPEEQQFLNDLDKKLWAAANRLLPMLSREADHLTDLKSRPHCEPDTAPQQSQCADPSTPAEANP